MDLRVLGPVEVTDGATTVPIGGPRQRLVLALLILRVGETVSTDRLVDDVWGDDPPDAARRTVQAYVSNLRKTLEAIRPGTLIARSPGYVLTVDDEAIDARRFEQSLTLGTRLLETNPAQAASVLGEGLALWRGAPYADLAGLPSLRTEITRLEELRTNAIETRIAADLALGGHGQVVGELETLVSEHPFNERFAGQLMVALYRSGRQADALRVAHRTRTVLRSELGIDLSPDLHDLEQSILEHDPELQPPPIVGSHSLAKARPSVIRGFEIRRRIGGSPWAETFIAYQRSLDREVAVRVINPRYANDSGFMARFEAGIARLIRVTHPNIVPFYDFWRDPEGAYIVRRYFPRGSLADAIEDGSWDAADTPRLIAQVGSALEAAHRGGFVHMNVKASNIMLDDESNAYITDFAVERSAFADDGAFLTDARASGSPSTDHDLLAKTTPQMDIRALAGIARQLLGDTDLPPAVAEVLEEAASSDPVGGFSSMDRFVEAFLDATGEVGHRSVTVSHNPYKGLQAFDETDRDDFCGREALVVPLLKRLSPPHPGCLALVGASGVGKSSILNAGLIPALRDGAIPGSERWRILKMHPGVHPFGELAGALRQVTVDMDPQIPGHLTWGDIGIGEALTSASRESTDEFLLVVDQFEELFTLVRDESVRSAFIDSLVAAVHDPAVRLRLILALRADFYDRPLRYPSLADLLTGCVFTVMPMAPGDLRKAILEPAERAGAVLDPGLAGRIVDDVQRQPGMLPLVQYAMTNLFDHRDGNRITADAYEELGGVTGPLQTRPEEIYLELDSHAREAARQVFLRLVALGDANEAVRRRVRRSELTSIVGYEHSARTVIDAFGDARLLSFDRHPVTRSPTVEIAHDALLGAWERLRGWIDDYRSDVRLHQSLADATADWIASDRDSEFLLVGGPLHRLAGWSKATDLALSDAEHSYLAASVEASTIEEREEAERIRYEHELEIRSRRRLRMLVVVWAMTALVAVLAIFAFAQWRRSEMLVRQTEVIAIADQYASMSEAQRATDPELALLLALHAVEITKDAGYEVTLPSRVALTLSMRALGMPLPPDTDQQLANDSLAALIDTARSHLNRGFTPQECSLLLGLDACPADTIASPSER